MQSCCLLYLVSHTAKKCGSVVQSTQVSFIHAFRGGLATEEESVAQMKNLLLCKMEGNVSITQYNKVVLVV